MAGSIVARDFLGTFNGQFLGWLLGFGAITVIFLFYFNRFVAFILFALIRVYTWFFYRVHVNCQAIQVSLLGGRIFFRGLSYHGKNETILVHQVYVTWQYWYRRVADVDVSQPKHRQRSASSSSETSEDRNDTRSRDSEGGDSRQSTNCRISAQVRGVEWFVYNRSPAYDAIVSSASQTLSKRKQENPSGSDPYETALNLNENDLTEGKKALRRASQGQSSYSEKPQPSPPVFLKLLPIYVECAKAAMVMGNSHTRSVLVAKVDQAKGRINAHSSGLLDVYKQSFEFELIKPVIRFIPNEDYVEPLLTAGAHLNGVDGSAQPGDAQSHHKSHKISRHRARHALGRLLPQLRRSVESFDRRSSSLRRGDTAFPLDANSPGQPKWIGLTRYLDEEEEDQLEHNRWQAIEYAKTQTIAEFSTISMTFYWDIPGIVVATEKPSQADTEAAKAGDINRSVPPDYGVELRLGEGTVMYGPWADRQRVDFMTVFFPSAYMDVLPASPLETGQTRVNTVFNISIILDEKVELRLLTREPSKDWKHKGSGQNEPRTGKGQGKGRQYKSGRQAKASFDPQERHAGWLNISIATNTAVSYKMDMIPRETGFKNDLSIDVVSLDLQSSVNSDVLLRSASMTVLADISNPSGWNSPRTWRFDISANETDLFMLREHAFLVQDLVEDFTLGPPPGFYTFVPFVYDLRLSFDNLRVYLNANEANIIDKPSDVNENIFLLLEPQRLAAKVVIPADQLSPSQSKISFHGDLEATKFRVLTPGWNTYHALFQSCALGSFPAINVDGSYTYCAESSPTNTDTLLMDIHGLNPEMYLYGFLIRYFLNFQDNYFGKDVHFQTLEEYQGRLDKPGRKHAADNDHKPSKASSDLDVILSITTENASIMLPSNIYNNNECVKIDLQDGHADLRFTNYYMDLQTLLSPLSISHLAQNGIAHEKHNTEGTGTQTFVDGATITGHRLFGLPPDEPTYACNWDFDVGDISGESSIEFLSALVSGIQAFIYGFDDKENALPGHEEETLNDVTFIRASVNPIKLWLLVDSFAFLCELAASRVEFNDLSSRRFSERLLMIVPNIVLAVVDRAAASENQLKASKAMTYGYLQTSLDFRMLQSKANFKEERQKQQDHIRLQDARTFRTPWLVKEHGSLSSSQFPTQLAKLHPPASQFPPIPEPLETKSIRKPVSLRTGSSRSTLSARKSKSFLIRIDSSDHVAVGAFGYNNSSEISTELRNIGLSAAGENIDRVYGPSQTFRGHAATLTSSYRRPKFPFHVIQPSDADVPSLWHSKDKPRQRADSDIPAEDLPAEDDGIIHVSFMINLESGLRISCTPLALDGMNCLLSFAKSKEPGTLLDGLQMDSLGAVVASRKPEKVPESIQIRLELPGAAVRFRHHHSEQTLDQEAHQSYEIALYDLVAFGRLGAKRPQPLGKTPSSMQLSVAELELEAKRGLQPHVNDAQIIGKLRDLNLWAHEAEEITGQLQFKSFETASLNRRIEHLASLVNEAGSLANRLGSEFDATLKSQKGRLQYLVYHLATTGQHVADPSILNSASFISRSSGSHVRASDSWKMIMRLRWILRSMDTTAQAILTKQCSKDIVPIPSDAQNQVFSCFKNWREWDLQNMHVSALMRELYGKAAPVPNETLEQLTKPIRLAFVSGKISLAIDPSNRGSRVISEGLAVAVESLLEIRSGAGEDGQLSGVAGRQTVIETSCDKFLVELRLELLDAVEGIFSHVKELEASQPPVQPALAKSAPGIFTRQRIHAIALMKRADIRLRTKHLNASLRSDHFYSSVLALKASPASTRAFALLTAQSYTIGLRSQFRSLVRINAVRPSLGASLEQSTLESPKTNNIWKVGGQCREISLDVAENALGLLAVADQLISDEFVYFQEFLLKMKRADKVAPTNSSVESRNQNVIHLTLQLDAYRITTVIFSSLRYRLEGHGARVLLKPDIAVRGLHRLDLDIREHAHSVFNSEGKSKLEIGRLILPPIIGSVDVHQQVESTTLGVNVHVSVVKVDASAIHGVFSTLSRTELTRFGKNVSRDLDIVKTNFESVASNIKGQSPEIPSANSVDQTKQKLRFSAQVKLDGVAVVAQSSKSLRTRAELIVDSGPISFGVANYQKESEILLPFPDIDLRLDTVKVLLESLQDNRRVPCGSITLAFSVIGRSEAGDGNALRSYAAKVDRLEVDIYTETASMIIDILGYIQQRFKRFNLSEELHTMRAKRRRRTQSRVKALALSENEFSGDDDTPVALFDAVVSFQLRQLRVSWRVGSMEVFTPISEPEDLVFSIEAVDLSTRKGNTARLEIKSLQLQMVPVSQSLTERSNNSALLPEVVFKVAYRSSSRDRRLAFQALGQKLDLRLTSQFILPLTNIQRSIAVATRDLRAVLADWNETLVRGDSNQQSVLGDKKLASLIVDADFAGAEVFMEGRDSPGRSGARANRMSQHGRLGQYEDRNRTTLRSPGLAFKIEYKDTEQFDRSLNAEIKIAASKNELRPMFVPLVLEVISSVKDLVGQTPDSQKAVSTKSAESPSAEKKDEMTDPTTILGDCKLNVGLRICEQSFSLTCEPVAKVTATARFRDIYVTTNTVQPDEGKRFFAVSSTITGLETTVRHVYSRDPTGRFSVESIDMSLMNSEHVNGMKGISSILNISPVTLFLNVKQLQDFLTFREIWYPVEIRPVPQAPAPSTDQTIGGVQRYYQATATNPFSWNAAINIASLDLRLDLGQSVGRLSFSISKLWVMSRKDSALEQNLCLGFDAIGAKSEGRMSGSIELRNMRLRTNIMWQSEQTQKKTPLVQASLTFDDLRARAAFDYQTFAVADFQSLGFLLYNTSSQGHEGDRLICTVNGDKIHAYCTANVAAQSVALYQAIDRLIQEKLTAFEVSLQQMEKFQRQKAAAGLGLSLSQELSSTSPTDESEMTPVRLQVNVAVSLNSLKIGAYPRAFTDNQIFKLEALDALARFGVNIQDGQTHTLLTVVLGQLRVALSSVQREQRPKSRGEVAVEDVVKDSVASRGGTILKVPRVVATMQTWQPLHTKQVEYIFSSVFEGKVEVGWNYARISFIRTMWDTHSKALEARLGKPLPNTALQITSSPRPDADKGADKKDLADEDSKKPPKELITAVVNVPLSKYTYQAREPPIIQTPQLRDMGEATPPLEWIGLQRDKLPNLTHQVVIVPLLEFAKEIEDAYGKILGAT